MRKFLPIVVTLLVPVALGCATTQPPKELLDARSSYDRAAHGPAAAVMPAELENARQALHRAEASFEDSPSSEETRDLAYIAQRKVLSAEAVGRAKQGERARQGAEQQFKSTAARTLQAQGTALENERQRGAMTTQALAAEQQARAAAEKRAKDAMDRLTSLASIKEEQRGTVITLSGSVLFATDKTDLLPTASERLNQVADALKEQPDRVITVLGHTDAQGDAAYNQKLSERRAESVRSYLVSRGIPNDQIKAVGRGKTEPVADNNSAEGRANNRRVEILLSPKTGN